MHNGVGEAPTERNDGGLGSEATTGAAGGPPDAGHIKEESERHASR